MPFNGQAARAAYKADSGSGGGEQVPIPAGWHPARITLVKEGLIPKSGDGEMMRLHLDVHLGGGAARPIRQWYVHEHSNQDTMDIANRKLGQIVDVTGKFMPQDWVGQEIDVLIEPDGQFYEVEQVAPLGSKTGGIAIAPPDAHPAPAEDPDAIPF